MSGNIRLQGFEEKWKKIKMGDVTNLFSRRNKELIDARVYSVTNDKGFIFQDEKFGRELASNDLSNYKIIKKNEFAYNPARINVGSIAYFEDKVGIISSLYVCFSTNEKIEDNFLSYLLELDKTKHDLARYGEGGVRVYLWYPLFASIKIHIPTIDEQKEIVKILKTFDKEIQLLKDKVVSLENQKRGLMQKLFTGKIRV